MRTHVSSAALVALLVAVPLAQGLSKPKDIVDCYRLLVREHKMADILTNAQGVWSYKETLDGEAVEALEKPVVDVRNGYIRLSFETRGTRNNIELAYFISADKRNFIAVSDDYRFMEGSGYEFKFYNCDNDRISEISPFPARITYGDFLNAPGRREVEKLIGKNESRCVITYQLPRIGTSVMALLRGAPTDVVGNDQRTMDEINAAIKKYREYSKIELAWDMKKAAFVIRKKHR
jgi:hypothetical protein